VHASTKTGFIGLGLMGHGMARSLVGAGVDLLVFDTDPAAVKRLVESGAKAASSIGELASQSRVVFTSLPGPVQVEEVVLGREGILDNTSAGKVLFDLSTNSLTLARRIHEAFKQKGAHMLDAPISGGPAGAASGELAIWVGGEKEVFERNLDLLHIVAKSPRYVGAIGAGTITKLVHNLTGYMFQLTFAETFSLGVKAGVDPLDLWEALHLGLVGKGSPLNMLTKQFLPGKYDQPSFRLKGGHKDVGLATAMARELGVPMRLANMTLEEMTEGMARGWGEHDARAFLQLQLERAGVRIAVDPGRLEAAIKAVS